MKVMNRQTLALHV